MVFYPQPPRAGSAPTKSFFGPPGRADQVKNLGLVLEGFISTNNDTTEKYKNISNIVGPR